MNDYWNNPPESPDPPSCPNDKPKCDGFGEYLYNGKTGMVFSCDTCGYQWVIPFPIEPEPEPDILLEDIEGAIKPESALCPHGNKPEDCDACYIASDLAYDAARERSFR